MAIMKHEYNSIRVITGDDKLDTEAKTELEISYDDVVAAINAENLTDRIFGRMLKLRRKRFETLADKLPGTKKK